MLDDRIKKYCDDNKLNKAELESCLKEARRNCRKVPKFWILKQLEEKRLRLPEDRERLTRTLKEYSKRYQEFFQYRDINTYNFYEIEDVLEFMEAEGFAIKPSKSASIRKMKSEGLELYRENKHYVSYKILTPEAAQWAARGTRWCTSDLSTAKHYMENNQHLYLIYEKTTMGKLNKFAQINESMDQCMDVRDQDLDTQNAPHSEALKAVCMVKFTDRLDSMGLEIAGLADKFTKLWIPRMESYFWEYLRKRNIVLEDIKFTSAKGMVSYAINMYTRLPEEMEKVIMQNHCFALDYVYKVIRKSYPPYERSWVNELKRLQKTIDPRQYENDEGFSPIYLHIAKALHYAVDVKKGPFKAAEPYILNEDSFSSHYIVDALKKAMPEKEHVIAECRVSAFQYAKDILKGPFPKGEKAIGSHFPDMAFEYAKDILCGAFKKGEMAIASDKTLAFNYAKEIIKKPFPQGEEQIAKDPYLAYEYASTILKGRFLLFEESLELNSTVYFSYLKNVLQDALYDPWDAPSYSSHTIDLIPLWYEDHLKKGSGFSEPWRHGLLAKYRAKKLKEQWRPELINKSEESLFLARYCSSTIEKWWDAESFDWQQGSRYLAQYCRPYFWLWWDAEKFNRAATKELIKYNSSRLSDWWSPKHFDWAKLSGFLACHCSDDFEIWWDAKKFNYEKSAYSLVEHCVEFVDHWWRLEHYPGWTKEVVLNCGRNDDPNAF